MNTTSEMTMARGRDAKRPLEIPLEGWWDVVRRTWSRVGGEHVSMISASIAFYGLLALFPAIAAMIAIGGSVISPHELQTQMTTVSSVLPPEAASIILNQAKQVASNDSGGLALAAIVGLLVTLYSASRGMKALMEGLNIVYGETESRGLIRLNLAAFTLTLGLILGMVLALTIVAVVPAVIAALGLSGILQWVVSLVRWPILFLAAMLGLGVIYRYGPSRRAPRWTWVSWGSLSGTALWVLGSVVFSAYVSNFGSYNETYGSLGAVIILLLWFWLSAFIVLLGGGLNAELEHQTRHDTTLGDPRPMGKRNAYMADTLGESPVGSESNER